jgi:hypothetical protein
MKIDSKTLQQLSSSGKAAQDERTEKARQSLADALRERKKDEGSGHDQDSHITKIPL